jgi:hypothetical protein
MEKPQSCPKGTSIADRIRAKLVTDPVTGCCLWMGGRDKKGYGRITVRPIVLGDDATKSRTFFTHRATYEIATGVPVGSIPPEIKICHSCDNPPCNNFDHLFKGSHKQNMEDGRRKKRFPGRSAPGQANPKAKLTEAQVSEIRKRYAWGLGKKLAKEFNVSQVMICNIAAGRNWMEPAKRKPKAKLQPRLTAAQAEEIKKRYQFGNSVALGREFGVSDVTIQNVVRGKWKPPAG